jgi:FkbM family methyltransferase
MIYDYVDIGTSNFDTSLDVATDTDNIILVEPIKRFLDDLPSGDNIIKVNCAIGSKPSTDVIYSVRPGIGWEGLYGCNQIGKIHPLIKYEIGRQTIQASDVISESIEIITFQQLCEQYDITWISQLKIDTEGHEAIILKQVLQKIKKRELVVDEIKFEYNYLSDKQVLDHLILAFKEIRYIPYYEPNDVRLVRN